MSKKSPTSIPGIYLITNSVTGTVYVGQARNIRRRWESHRHYLVRGLHHNSYLQRAWAKYGEASFVFAVWRDLSGTPASKLRSELNRLEEEAVLSFDKTYNLAAAGVLTPLASAETRALWSAQRRAMWAVPGARESKSLATKILYQDAEWKAQRDAAVRAAKQTPEQRAVAKATFDALWATPEHRAAQSAKRKANWSDPTYREQQSASRKAAWADPEVRARRIAAIRAAKARKKLSEAAD